MKAISFIKKNAIAMSIALTAVIGFSAFKASENKAHSNSAVSDQYWDFNGLDPQDANNYSPASFNSSCEDGETVCQIFAPSDGNPTNPKPMLNATAPNHGSETVSQRITQALQSEEGNETVSLLD